MARTRPRPKLAPWFTAPMADAELGETPFTGPAVPSEPLWDEPDLHDHAHDEHRAAHGT
jgi:hypothetical protein